METKDYLNLFNTQNLKILPALNELADFFYNLLDQYTLVLNNDGLTSSMIIFNSFELSKQKHSTLIEYSYCGNHPVLKDYFNDLDNSLEDFPIYSIWTKQTHYDVLVDNLINVGFISLLSEKVEQLNSAHEYVFHNTNFITNGQSLVHPESFDSIFCNPIRDFLKLLLSDNINAQPIELKKLIGRRSEFITKYIKIACIVKEQMFDQTLLSLLGDSFDNQNIRAYNEIQKKLSKDECSQLKKWNCEHKYKSHLLFWGRNFKCLNFNDKDTFSHKNLVLSDEQRTSKIINSSSPILFDRVSFRYLWSMDEELLLTLLDSVSTCYFNGEKHIESQPSVLIFLHFIYWLAHTKVKTIDLSIFKIILKGRFVECFFKHEHNTLNIKNFFYGLDALYIFAYSIKYQKIMDLKVLISDVQDFMIAKCENVPNYMHFTKTLTGNSLQHKSVQWHKKMKVDYYLKYKFILPEMKISFDTFKIELITTVDELLKETEQMGHCVLSYACEVMNEEYYVFKMYDNETNDRATIGFSYKDGKYIFDQIRGFNNNLPSDRLLDAAQTLIDSNFLNCKNSA